MESLCRAIVAVLLVSSLMTPASAEIGAPKRSYESCTDLARQRGFVPPDRHGAMKHFVMACMRGRQS
jgi:hypothetical protein